MRKFVNWCWEVDKVSTIIFLLIVSSSVFCLLNGNYTQVMLSGDIGTLYGMMLGVWFTSAYYKEKLNK